MATINGLYVFVESESKSRSAEVTKHAVENGIGITDNVKRNPFTISISGKIVGENASTVISKINNYMSTGVFVNYSGKNGAYNCLISKFDTDHPNTVWGGCEFSLELQEVRIARSGYVSNAKTSATKKGGTQQIQKNTDGKIQIHTVKKGDTIWALVAAPNAPYRSCGLTCQQVMQKNPDAFSRKGDFRTLKIGYKLKL